MSRRYSKHYSVEEAEALLPQIRVWLDRLEKLRDEVHKSEVRLKGLMLPGADLGGSLVTDWIRGLACVRELLLEFQRRQLQLKDIDRGLVDFPAIIDDREVFLCWEKEEEKIEFWHELDTGYAGREHL